MPTFGNEVCPFTGGKFAGVKEGRGDTFLVHTPVLREEVALTRELYEDLPNHPTGERLGLRRWAADMIDAGSLPALLTGEHLLAHREHPPPSAEVKAYRLLGWMVAERLAQNAPDRKFEFDKDGVHGKHEACLVTESDDRQQLLDPLQRLQALGYVEFVGPNEQAVRTPGLTVRLTAAGIEDAGRVPMVHQASAHLGSESRDRLRTTEIGAPPGEQQIFLEGDLGENGGQVVFATVKEFVDWAAKEEEFWDFLVERHTSLPKDTLARTIANHISQITVHGRKLVNTGADDPNARRRLNDSFEAYRSGATLHSSNVASVRVRLICEKLGVEAALGALETIKSNDYQPTDRQTMSGAVAYVHLSQFGEPLLGNAEIDALRTAIVEIREQTANLVQSLRDDQRQVQAAHDAMVTDGRKLGRHALRVWRRFRRGMSERAGNALASLETTDRAYSEQMQLQAPVDYWTAKKSEHDSKAATLRWVLLGYVAASIIAIMLFVWNLPTLVPLYKGETLVFAGAAAAALLTIAFWGGRVLVRLYLSELHLAGDAWERAIMAKTYLALTKEGNAGDADRPIVLGALFRQSADGVVKEDNVPDTSLIAMLARVLDKRS